MCVTAEERWAPAPELRSESDASAPETTLSLLESKTQSLTASLEQCLGEFAKLISTCNKSKDRLLATYGSTRNFARRPIALETSQTFYGRSLWPSDASKRSCSGWVLLW